MNMQSKDVAAWLISHYGDDAELYNPVLNRLCFYAQVVALKRDGLPLFTNAIEAWECGPVCPNVITNTRDTANSLFIEIVTNHRILPIVSKAFSKHCGVTMVGFRGMISFACRNSREGHGQRHIGRICMPGLMMN